MRFILSLLVVMVLASCQEEVLVKPKAKLRLEYPEQEYQKISYNNCPFQFEINSQANPVLKENCWMNLDYPKMKATIYLTYYQVDDNLESLLYDAQKLTYDHTIKATNIMEQPRVDPVNKVYGMFYMINGDAATPSQFYVTDSVKHFITGSVYFKTKPNFDSIYPAAMYLRDDIRHLMETIQWN